MSSILNRVRQTIVSPAGTGGPLVLNTVAFSNAHTTINAAGGIDGAEYCYVIEENSDFEIQRGNWTSAGNTLARNTPIMSSISGSVGTSLMALAGNASIRVIIEASEMGGYRGVRAVVGASDTIANADLGFCILYNRSSAIAVSLASPGTNTFRNGYVGTLKNINTGLVTLTVSGGATITKDGTSSTILGLKRYESAQIFSDGSNYFAIVSSPFGIQANDNSGMSNGTLVASAAGGTLTVAVKTALGADPSPADPVFFYFRNNTLGTGDYVRIAVTAALSVILGSTKTLGASSAFGLRVWIGAFNNAGTVQLAAINCSDASGVFNPLESTKFTTAVPASSSKTWYSTSAIGTAAPWRFIGFVEWTTLTTAGTWTTPDIIHLVGPNTPRPGVSLQTVLATTTTSDTGTTSTSYVASAFTGQITPQSTANLVRARFDGGAFPTGSNNGQIRLQRGSSWNGASSCSIVPGSIAGPACSSGIDLPSSVAQLTYTVYRRVNNAATTLQCPYCNAAGDTNVIMLEELMG